MKIIIFGSDGMLGNYLFSYLSKKYKVIPLTRKDYDISKDSFDNLENMLLKNGINDNTLIINAIGIIPQASKNYILNDRLYIMINSIFPNVIAQICSKYNAKMIHSTTDCVYDGKDGKYDENSLHSASTIYGITKSLGEPCNCTVIRTSIIGEELRNNRSLLEWVKSNQGKEINGYTNHFWNGITCLQYAKVVEFIINNNMFWKGVRHIHSPNVVSKYELVSLINKIYKLNITINKHECPEICDRSLTSTIENSIFDIPSLDIQIKELFDYSFHS